MSPPPEAQPNPIVKDLSPEEHVRRLELALDSAYLGVWDWDLRDNSVHFDHRWCEMLGLEQSQTKMHLSTWYSRVHPDDLARCYADIEAYIQGRTPIYRNVHRMLHANGEWVYILDCGRISGRDAEGRPIRMTGTHTNVTQEEKARHLLEHQSQLFARMLRFLPSAVVMLDTELRLIVASERWLQTQGHTEESLRQLPSSAYFPDSGRDWQEVARQVLQGETLQNDRELAKRPDGRQVWYRWVCLPWERDHQEIGGLILMVEDLTESIYLQQRLESESRLRSLGKMAGGIAHEINNPLAIIRAHAEIIMRQQARDRLTPELLERTIGSIINTTQRIEGLMRALRNMSYGSHSIRLVPARLDTLIAETIELCRDRFAQKAIQLNLNLSALQGQEFGIDPAQISQIILNLLNNAYDAIHDLPLRWVCIIATVQEETVQIVVQDSGRGIAPDIVERMMTPFFTTKDVGAGMGLGLSLALSYAKNHGGDLSYQERGGHTTFVLAIPRHSPSPDVRKPLGNLSSLGSYECERIDWEAE